MVTLHCQLVRSRLARKSVAWLTDRPDMTIVVYRGRKTTIHNNAPSGGVL